MRRLALGLALALPLAAADGDVLDALLARGGMTRADLGFRSSAAARRPAFALPHLDPLRADPLALPRFGDVFAKTVERDADDAAALLLEGAVRPRLPAAAMPALPEEEDLARVLARLRRPLDAETAAEPDARDRADAARLPERYRRPLARLLAALDVADAGVRRAWADVPTGLARAALDARLVPELADGARPVPAVEEAVSALDAGGLATSSLLAASAVERAARELRGLSPPRKLRWEVATPRGKVRLAGSGSDRHVASDGPFLAIVDLGGDDRYEGSLAAGIWPSQPVSVLLDLGGDDRYDARDAAQGCGLGGVGVLFDVAGRDRYRAVSRAQGFAQLGVGVLVDGGGDDRYALEDAGQGSATFGTALLVDRGGDDAYELFHDGQGFGGPDGVGLLADLAGKDRYVAVRDTARAGRPDTKSDGKGATSNAQGVGLGRRGDLTDGRLWAGGLGALVDLGGDDVYTGGTWCQGAGYTFGTGLLVDTAGDDAYEAVWYAQGSAAHGALGLLLDRAGNDRYALVGTGGAGMGFGWDFAVGMLVDLSGNDEYRAVRLALGAAMQRSVGLFLDAAGDDLYDVAFPSEALGFVDEDARWRERDAAAPAWFETAQAGLFLDLGGRDSYAKGRAANDTAWGSWEEGRRTLAPRNFAGGWDGEAPAERLGGVMPEGSAPK